MVKGEHDFINYFKTPQPGNGMECEGKYDMPKLKGIKFKNPNKKLRIVGFNEAYKIPKEERKKYIVEFFLADYLFERVWTRLEPVTKFLKDFKMVMSPDFSHYWDMPNSMLIWQQYRMMFVCWYWQQNGIAVLPKGTWCDKRTHEYCFDGLPHHSCVVVSSVGLWDYDSKLENSKEQLDFSRSLFKEAVEKMISVLEPCQIVWYGKLCKWAVDLCKDTGIDIIPVKAHYCERFNHD